MQLLSHDTYHRGGQYLILALAPWFLLPSVKHAPTWWCVRQLLTTEEWQIYNVPWRVFRLVSELSKERLLFQQLLPGRCMEHELCYLLQGIGLMREGVLHFPNSEQLKEELERFKEAGNEDVALEKQEVLMEVLTNRKRFKM